MKTAALFLSIATVQVAAYAALPLSAAQAQEAPVAALTLAFKGITQPTGAIRGQLFADQAGYEGKGKAVSTFAVPVTGDSASLIVPGLAPGRYAVKAFHDVDGDGKMATNPFGIPTEPFAFSNDARGAFGPADWADAAFEVGPGETAHAITID
ncbi:DUF2141 domain-containing protein [Caulobacter mirabilis]|uniref:DUF2141 domain-containing protein n=1 Tax=Caulobacter mirabilis TaxID=69666 RepID=A0A2D2B4D6_9CAUL|nr:DUF2141 domain-containing protein [Caulobacter mirabilis]ATQ45131.1 hypothetical protein CSW64_19945 [Caulobacter mirabilis]